MIKAEYKKTLFIKKSFILMLVLCGAVFAAIGLWIGPMDFSSKEIIKTVLNLLPYYHSELPDTVTNVVLKIRLPRIVMALLSGFGLAVTGMQMQVILRNPLASPFTLGVSSGAALGASLSVVAGISLIAGRYMLIFNAFIFALIPAFIILILAGIALNFIFSSVSTLLSYFSNSEELKSLSLWMMGNLGRATWSDIIPLSTVILITIPFLMLQNQKLNVLNSGDESAKGLGVNVERTRITVLVLTSLVAAAIICFTGIIGFVGLVSPHIVRLIIGNDARYLMPASGVFGGVFLLGADLLSLKIIEPVVLPVGIITSFIGGPVLLYLIIKRQRFGAW